MSQFCKNCGNMIDNGVNFCDKCGSRVESLPNDTSFNQQGYSENGNNYNGNFRVTDVIDNPFKTYFMDVFKNKYAMFDGRASRKEYWMFVLFQFVAYIALVIVDGILGTDGLFMCIYSLASIVPSLALVVRRLHDIGKSGMWFFIEFVPFIGGLWLLILLCTQGQCGQNQYGYESMI